MISFVSKNDIHFSQSVLHPQLGPTPSPASSPDLGRGAGEDVVATPPLMSEWYRDRRVEAIKLYRKWENRFPFVNFKSSRPSSQNGDHITVPRDWALRNLLRHFEASSVEELGFRSQRHFWKHVREGNVPLEDPSTRHFPTVGGLLCSPGNFSLLFQHNLFSSRQQQPTVLW